MKIRIEISPKEKRVYKWILLILILVYISIQNFLFMSGHYDESRISVYTPSSQKGLLKSAPPESCYEWVKPYGNTNKLRHYPLGKIYPHLLGNATGIEWAKSNRNYWIFENFRDSVMDIKAIEQFPQCIGYLLQNRRKTQWDTSFLNVYDTESKKLIYSIIKYPERECVSCDKADGYFEPEHTQIVKYPSKPIK